MAKLDLLEPLRSVNSASRGHASLASPESGAEERLRIICVICKGEAAARVAEMQHFGRGTAPTGVLLFSLSGSILAMSGRDEHGGWPRRASAIQRAASRRSIWESGA